MKTVAEMARAAGFLSFNVSGWSNEFAKLDEMIRDDEREKQRAAMQMALEALETELKAFTRAEFDAATDKCVEAITALREVLNTRSSSTHSDAEYSEVAQPQGEWVDLTDDELKEVALPLVPDSYDENSDDVALKIFREVIAAFKAKNTPPVQREIPKRLDGGYELCEDEGCPNHGTTHYCRSIIEWKNIKQPVSFLSALEEINMLACYASEEAVDTREETLLRIGEIARSALAQHPMGYDQGFVDGVEEGRSMVQGEWVDLTDGEIEAAFTGSDLLGLHQPQLKAIYAVIAKFKDKNTPVQHEQQEPDVDLETMLRLIQTINYIVGIAERGEGRKILDSETPEIFVLDYVKKLEAKQRGQQDNANCRKAVSDLMDDIQKQRATMQTALKALIGMDVLFSHLSQDYTQYNAVDTAREAINDLREALEVSSGGSESSSGGMAQPAVKESLTVQDADMVQPQCGGEYMSQKQPNPAPVGHRPPPPPVPPPACCETYGCTKPCPKYYTTPQTATQAARDMKDAAVIVCNALGHSIAAQVIESLPILGEEK